MTIHLLKKAAKIVIAEVERGSGTSEVLLFRLKAAKDRTGCGCTEEAEAISEVRGISLAQIDPAIFRYDWSEGVGPSRDRSVRLRMPISYRSASSSTTSSPGPRISLLRVKPHRASRLQLLKNVMKREILLAKLLLPDNLDVLDY